MGENPLSFAYTDTKIMFPLELLKYRLYYNKLEQNSLEKLRVFKGSLASTVVQESGFPARDWRGSAVLIWAALALLTQTAREIFLVLRNLCYPIHVCIKLSGFTLLSKPLVNTFNMNGKSSTELKP